MKQRVLVADDDPNMLEALAAAVEDTGRYAFTVRDGGELIEAIGEAEHAFDLVITDISMPWMSGIQVSSSARYAGMDTPIIVVTALEDPGIDDMVRMLGGRVVLLRKPIDLAVLQRAIEDLTTNAQERLAMSA